MEPKVLERVKAHYIEALGRERGAMSEFARNLGLDCRVVNNWCRLRKVIPAIYAPDVEKVTGGKVKGWEVISEDLEFERERKDAMYARRKRVTV